MRFFGVSVPKSLHEAVGKCRPHFVSAALFSALVNVLFLAPTIYMMQIYDRVVPTSGTTTLLWLTLIVGLALATLAMLDSIRTRLMIRAAMRLNHVLARDVLTRLMARRETKPDEPTTAQTIRDFDSLKKAIGGQAFMALFDMPWTPIYFLVAFLIHPLLGLLIFLGAAILLVLAVFNARATRRSNDASLQTSAAAYSAQETALSNAEIIRALGMRDAMVTRQLAGREEGSRHETDAQFSAARYNSIVKFARMFLQSLSLGLGAWLAINGQISVGAIIAASVLLSRALQPIELLVRVWPTITQARNAANSIDELFEETDQIFQNYMELPVPKGKVNLESVSISNSEGTIEIIHNISFKISPGEIVGLIGPSGAGKSTTARAVVGAVEIDSGSIRIDGANYKDWDPEQLAEYIGYLPQEPSLLRGTIRENISRFAADKGVSDEVVDRKVIEAAKKADIHDLILRLPSGYKAQLGNGGAGLSRGQAQRIALARALYNDPPLLVLDEPSSALDSLGEQALLAATSAAKKRGAAVLIIAHRAGILSDADRIVVMRDGKIDRDGPKQEIVEALKSATVSANVVSMKNK